MRKRTELEISLRGESKAVKGYQVSKSFFTYKDGMWGWTVTHIKTGLCVLGLERSYLEDVQRACERAEKVLDWDSILTPDDVVPVMRQEGFPYAQDLITAMYDL